MDDDIDCLIEIPGLYDGYSIIVRKDGTWDNRWAAHPGYERLAVATQAYIEQNQPAHD